MVLTSQILRQAPRRDPLLKILEELRVESPVLLLREPQ
jgi:hypothetical protein